jgi:Tol biopolymer transport system component
MASVTDRAGVESRRIARAPSLLPDGKLLAYSQVDETPSDIMLVDHFQ